MRTSNFEHPDHRLAYRRVFDDDFADGVDPRRWIAHYLPEWTTSERSAARYDTGPGGLTLRIDADQPAWRPEDGELRVSNLQTGTRSGPLGSDIGQMVHRPDLVVRSPQTERRLWTPTAGRVEAVVAANPDPTVMLAVWLVGFREIPGHSGEILLFELYGGRIGPGRSVVRLGVKAHQDPHLTDEVVDLEMPIDATQDHAYGVEWGPFGVRFLIQDELVAQSDQVLGYPLQLMVDLFEFPADADRDPAAYPKPASVRRITAAEPQPHRH